MEGEIYVWHGIKGAEIRLNQSNNTTTYVISAFTHFGGLN